MKFALTRAAGIRRIAISTVTVVLLLAASARSASACFFGCIYHFGYFTVSNGELYYYNGCYSYTVDGETYVTCYYSSALN
jgi:nicotinamide riboside transporter PnuC